MSIPWDKTPIDAPAPASVVDLYFVEFSGLRGGGVAVVVGQSHDDAENIVRLAIDADWANIGHPLEFETEMLFSNISWHGRGIIKLSGWHEIGAW